MGTNTSKLKSIKAVPSPADEVPDVIQCAVKPRPFRAGILGTAAVARLLFGALVFDILTDDIERCASTRGCKIGR